MKMHFGHALEQCTLTFLAPGTGFMEDKISTDHFGRIQAHYIYHARYNNKSICTGGNMIPKKA